MVHFSGQAQDSFGLSDSILSSYGSLWRLAIPRTKNHTEEGSFQLQEDIMRNMTTELYTIPKEALKQWQHCWEKCVQYKGDYFEGD